MQLPCIEVSQLAPSTSFYAAVLQPLGLRYLTSESIASGSDFATFGCCQGPVLHLRQIARPTALRLSSIRISAPSSAAIQAFYRQGIEANPASIFAVNDPANHSTILDLDGNIMQAVCTGHVCRPDMITGQVTLLLNPQQETHVSRVLDWNNRSPEPSGAKIADGGIKDAPGTKGSPAEVDSTQTKTEDTKTPSGGASTVLSALLGVAAGAAAGAAITYGVMSARTPELVSAEVDSRQRSLPNEQPVPLRPQRITFQEDQASVLRKAPTQAPSQAPSQAPTRPPAPSRAPASVHESAVSQSRSKNIEVDDQEDKGQDLVQIPNDAELPPMKPSSRAPTTVSSSETRTNVADSQLLKKDHETVVSAHSRVSSSTSLSKRDSHQRSTDEKSSVSEPRPKEPPSLNPRSPTEISQRPSKAAADQSGASEFFDTRSHASVSRTGVSAARHSSSPDKRSHVSARDIPLPASRATSVFLDTQSHASASKTSVSATRNEDKCSRVSARDIPLPASRATSVFLDTQSHASASKTNVSATRNEDKRSRVSAKDIPLPASRATSVFLDTQSHTSANKTNVSATRHHSNEDKHSHVSAKDIPLPASRATSVFLDTQSHTSASKTNASATRHHSNEDKRSQVSAKDIPLPASRVGTSEFLDTQSHASRKTDVSASRNHNGEDKRSRVSARDVPLPASRVGTNEFFDTVSHVSRKTDVSARRTDASSGRMDASSRKTEVSASHHHSDDKRSRISARDVPLPSSRVGTNEFFDTVSHVSTIKAHSSTSRKDVAEDSRSHTSARNVPLPASCVGSGSKFADRHSQVSAQNIPLPASCVGTNYREGTASHISARNIPLPGSHVGSSRANWDDDLRSIAPSDSISCVGAK